MSGYSILDNLPDSTRMVKGEDNVSYLVVVLRPDQIDLIAEAVLKKLAAATDGPMRGRSMGEKPAEAEKSGRSAGI